MLEGEVATRASLGLPDAVILDGRDTTNYVIAEEAGLFEGLLEPGDDGERRRAGRPALVPRPAGPRPRHPARRRSTASSPCIRAIPVTEAGDSVFVTGQPIAAADLL